MGPVQIHLSGYEALDAKTITSVCCLYGDDADALYAAWSASGVDGRFHPPSHATCGMREFGYAVPNGNLLRVGSPLKSNASTRLLLFEMPAGTMTCASVERAYAAAQTNARGGPA